MKFTPGGKTLKYPIRTRIYVTRNVRPNPPVWKTAIGVMLMIIAMIMLYLRSHSGI